MGSEQYCNALVEKFASGELEIQYEEEDELEEIKKAMAEAGLTRDQVQGSGKDGRVMKEDVARAVSGAPAAHVVTAAAPAVAAAPQH